MEERKGGDAGIRAALLIIGLMLVLVQGTPAFTVSGVTIDPSGALTPGTPVVINGTIYFEPSSDDSPPVSRDLLFSTDLEHAKWTRTFFLKGDEITQTESSVSAADYLREVHYIPDFSEDSEIFSLTGTAPTVTRAMNFTLFRICEQDNHSSVVPGSCDERTTVVVYVWEVRDRIKSVETNLSLFRSHIDEKAAMGVDTLMAKAKYAEADQHLKSASHMDSSRYLDRYKDLELAEAAITDGERLLDKAWAEKEIADARVPVQNAERVIGWFTGNASTRDDPQLRTIMTKREVALGYLTTAEEELASGNYSRAREKAEDAFNKGNESYTDALQRSDELQRSGCDTCIHPESRFIYKVIRFIPAIAIIIAAILCIAGLYWWRKRKKAKPE